MAAPRPRRIVRRAAMTIAAIVLAIVAWLAFREPPVVGQSKALRLGMTRAEVEAILGPPSVMTGDATLFYGASGNLMVLESRLREWFGVPPAMLDLERFPVHVSLQNDHVVNIYRSGEVVRSSADQPSQVISN